MATPNGNPGAAPGTNRPGNDIRGPQSALSSFLRSQGITADRNLLNFARRQRDAEQQAAADAEARQIEQNQNQNPTQEITTEQRKRKAAEDKAIARIKKSKRFDEEKARPRSSQKDDDEIAREMYRFDVSAKAGQLENCAQCAKRFTVTPYTKAGPTGGLLCPKCAKELGDGDGKAAPKKRKAATPGHTRRQTRAKMLDGVSVRGARKLFDMCLHRAADEANDIEDFGEASPPVLVSLSQLLSRRRAINSHTLQFFIGPDKDFIYIPDAAGLATSDFLRIFMMSPNLERVDLDCAGQFKNEVLDFVSGHPLLPLTAFHLGAPNLITDESWRNFFASKGANLKSFETNYCDGHFDDETVASLVEHCTQLQSLKLTHMWKPTARSIECLAGLRQLRHLTLARPFNPIPSAAMVSVIESVGHQLETLVLDDFAELDDQVLEAIHAHCRRLSKLRLEHNERFTDRALEGLFRGWANHGVTELSFWGCRDVCADDPTGNVHGRGMCGEAFKAMMAHSRSRLRVLDVTSCRHIPHAALLEVFANDAISYPQLEHVNLSFVGAVDEAILAGLFRACPRLQRVEVFGCFGVADAVPPRGVFLVGRAGGSGELTIVGE